MSTLHPGWLTRRSRELRLALMMLTRLPVPAVPPLDDEAVSRRVWAYPVVGALIGALGALAFATALSVGLTSKLAAAVALATTILVTGCFHEDGLADFWDGIGGGKDRERKLEIMRDSRIGSYGAAALGLSLLARWAALAAFTDAWTAAAALIAAHAGARGLLAPLFVLLAPARKEGLAAAGDRPPTVAAGLAFALGIAAPLAFWPVGTAIPALAVAVVLVAIMGLLMQRQISGYTGDALGASEQVLEIGLLFAATLLG